VTANEQVEKIIRDYIKVGLDVADTGTPTGLDPKTWEACIYQIRNLHLAEPWLPAFEAIAAMQPEPVTVTTVEELEALPNWTIAQQDSGTVLEQRSRDGGLAAWYGYIGGRMLHGETSQWVADKINLGSEYPVTVLYSRPTPQADVLAEVRAQIGRLPTNRTASWAHGGWDSVSLNDVLAILDKYGVPEGKE